MVSNSNTIVPTHSSLRHVRLRDSFITSIQDGRSAGMADRILLRVNGIRGESSVDNLLSRAPVLVRTPTRQT